MSESFILKTGMNHQHILRKNVFVLEGEETQPLMHVTIS